MSKFYLRGTSSGIDIYCIFMGIILATLFILPSYGNAVNSYACTGNYDEKGHNYNRDAMLKVQDELNNEYNMEGQSHQCDDDGEHAADYVMNHQSWQYQHSVIMAHGDADNKGMRVAIGYDHDEDILSGNMMINNMDVAIEGNFYHAGAPMTIVQHMSSYGGRYDEDNTGDHYWKDVFIDDNKDNDNSLNCWMFMGLDNSADQRDAKDYIETYADRITRKDYNYDKAINVGVDKTNHHDFKLRKIYWGGGGRLEHDTRHDRYAYINREEEAENTVIEEGETQTFYLDRSGYSHQSNGAYVIFHGLINDEWARDTSKETDIQIKIYRWESSDGGYYVLKKSTLFSNLVNTETTLYSRNAYGGSPICTSFITYDDIESTENNKIKIELKHVDGPDLRIRRLEIIEIGSKSS